MPVRVGGGVVRVKEKVFEATFPDAGSEAWSVWLPKLSAAGTVQLMEVTEFWVIF